MESNIYKGVVDQDITRYECLSHVAKRMKTNLSKAQYRILKAGKKAKEFDIMEMRKASKHSEEKIKYIAGKTHKGKLVRDSKTCKEWDASTKSVEIRTLSDSVCGQIASYYRIAVQRHKGNIDDILKAIQAIPFHLGANNQNAEEFHKYCPANSESWCKYQSAKASNNPIPNHPNYLSQGCVDFIFKVFEEFGYNSQSFISKISDGRTSNHNEAVHSILFRMIRKTEQVGIELMKLGSALAVIRYNDGFYGILALYETLGVKISDNMASIFSEMDTRRIIQSRRILTEQSKRFLKKKRRCIKTTRLIKRHGGGYKSGKYSAAQKLEFNETSESEDDDITKKQSKLSEKPGPSPLVTEKEQQDEEEYCEICKGTEENGIVGIGLTIHEVDQEIAWVSCSKCLKWFHLICLGIDLEDMTEDDWYCDEC